MTNSFTKWWIENYEGWGEFKTPSTFPYPFSHRSQGELLAKMNAKLSKEK